MDLAFYLLFFILGTVVGSFINVVVDRIPKNESIIAKRSYCDHCKKPLSWFDLVPLLSFFLLGGKSRCCDKKISWQYPAVEFATGGLFVLTDLRMSGFELLLLAIIGVMITIFVSDVKYNLIYDQVIAFGIVAAFLLKLATQTPPIHFLTSILAGLSIVLLFLVLYLVTKGRGFGLGDVKFGFLIGFLLDWQLATVAIFFSFLTGGIISAFLVILGRKHFGQTIAFGPFLVLGTLIALFVGRQIIDLYLGRF